MFLTFLKRREASVLRRTVLKGDCTILTVAQVNPVLRVSKKVTRRSRSRVSVAQAFGSVFLKRRINSSRLRP